MEEEDELEATSFMSRRKKKEVKLPRGQIAILFSWHSILLGSLAQVAPLVNSPWKKNNHNQPLPASI